MSHSQVNVYIHVIWTTKDRYLFINKDLEPKLYSKMFDLFEEKDCQIIAINGMADHVHILFSLNQNHSLSDVIKKVKGSSSNWINKHQFLKVKFKWQIGFAAYSVSVSKIKSVIKYIQNQKEHHKNIKLQDELDEFALRYSNLKK